jgi:hypothetical protein
MDRLIRNVVDFQNVVPYQLNVLSVRTGKWDDGARSLASNFSH